jgi:hypothetical protein
VAYERTRTKSEVVNSGYAKYTTGVPISGHNTNRTIRTDRCIDVVRTRREGDNQDLNIYHYSMSGGRLNGKTRAGAEFIDFLGTGWGSQSTFGHYTGLPGNPSDTAVATNAAARTNPSRPYVDVAAEVLQLADIVHLIRKLGRSWIRKAAQTNLNYQFGIKPMVDSLVDLSDFANALDKRLEVMQKLQRAHGYRRTTQHGVYSKSGTWQFIAQTQGVSASITSHSNTVQRVACHCRWLPIGNFNRLGNDAVRELATNALLGIVQGNPLNMDMSTIWEALPWTWLLDWGGSVGNYFTANRNIVPCYLSSCSVVRETATITKCNRESGDGVTFGEANVVFRDRTRKRAVIGPVAQFPLLSANQMGILTSLAITRRR